LAKENIEVQGIARRFATEKNARQLSTLGVYSEKMLSEVITNSCLEE
jgi:hypothetical protein